MSRSRSRKAIFVGEVNELTSDPRHALHPYPVNGTGDRLCHKVLRLKPSVYLTKIRRVNLCLWDWDMDRAKLKADSVVYENTGPIVLLGSRVAKAFGLKDIKLFSVFQGIKGTRLKRTFVLLPHPSGRCRVWNDKGSYQKARRVLKKAGVKF